LEVENKNGEKDASPAAWDILKFFNCWKDLIRDSWNCSIFVADNRFFKQKYTLKEK
jgi:hypothetical protein